jgi:hypothetical protein
MEMLIIFLCLCNIVTVCVVIYLLAKDTESSSGCTGNCNQGRRCDCKDIK